jgi:DNA (cytosine-5)-methyltransferase 1
VAAASGEKVALVETTEVIHDPVCKLLRGAIRAMGMDQIITKLARTGVYLAESDVEQHLAHLERGFVIERKKRSGGAYTYRLGEFKVFVGQEGHERHELFAVNKAKIS